MLPMINASNSATSLVFGIRQSHNASQGIIAPAQGLDRCSRPALLAQLAVDCRCRPHYAPERQQRC